MRAHTLQLVECMDHLGYFRIFVKPGSAAANTALRESCVQTPISMVES